MDFSSSESKPEVLKNLPKTFPPERHVVDRNKQDLLKFFNVTPKTRVALAVSAAGILLFFFSIYTGAFQNRTLDTLYPKEESQASQTIELHTAPDEPGFGFSGSTLLTVNNQHSINLEVHTGTESATVMAAQIHFDPKSLEVNAIVTEDSIVSEWIDNNVSNADGVISLVASFPKGYQAKKGDNYAKIVLTPKVPGQTALILDKNNSNIYRMGDKKEITIQRDQIHLKISE